MRTIYGSASGTGKLTASGGTGSIAIVNPIKRPLRIVRVRAVVVVDEAGTTGPAGYDGEGLDYVAGYLENNTGDPKDATPRAVNTPLRLWADGHPPHKPEFTIPVDGATLTLINNHPNRDAGVHFALDCEEA